MADLLGKQVAKLTSSQKAEMLLAVYKNLSNSICSFGPTHVGELLGHAP